MKKKLKISKSLTRLLRFTTTSDDQENKISSPIAFGNRKTQENLDSGQLFEAIKTEIDKLVHGNLGELTKTLSLFVDKTTNRLEALLEENKNLNARILQLEKANKKQQSNLEDKNRKPMSYLDAAKMTKFYPDKKNFHFAVKVKNTSGIDDRWLAESCNFPKPCKISDIKLLKSPKCVIYTPQDLSKPEILNTPKRAICTSKYLNTAPFKTFKIKINGPGNFTIQHFLNNPKFFPEGTLVSKFRFPKNSITGTTKPRLRRDC